MKVIAASLAGLITVTLLAVPGRAVDSDEAKLESTSQTIDRDSASKSDPEKTAALAKQFKVSEETVQNLRGKGKGWGGVTIELAMAQKLSSMDPKTYPAMSDALTK